MTRRNERSVLSVHKRGATRSGEKWPRSFGLRPKRVQAVLLVVHLEGLNFTPRALSGRIWGSNTTTGCISTGPKVRSEQSSLVNERHRQNSTISCPCSRSIYYRSASHNPSLSLQDCVGGIKR